MVQGVVLKFRIYFFLFSRRHILWKVNLGLFIKMISQWRSVNLPSPRLDKKNGLMSFSSLFFWVNFWVSVSVLFIHFINPIPIFQQGSTMDNSYMTQSASYVIILSCHLLLSIVSGSKISDPSSDCWEFGAGSYTRARKLTGLITYLWHLY